MCDSKEKELAACDKLVQALQKNGRCEYHEDLVKNTNWVKGGLAVVLLLLSFIVYTTRTTSVMVSENTVKLEVVEGKVENANTKLEIHMDESAHPIMHQKANDLERRLNNVEEKVHDHK